MITIVSVSLPNDDRLVEWEDVEAGRCGVQVERDMRGLPDLFFTLKTPEKAHELYMLLLDAEGIEVDGDGPDEEPEHNFEAEAQEATYVSDVEQRWYQCDEDEGGDIL